MMGWLGACSGSGNRQVGDGALAPDLAGGPADRSDGGAQVTPLDGGAPDSALDGTRGADTFRFDSPYQHPDQDATFDDAWVAGTLRFDGLYQHPEEGGYTGYLRFYEDGTVLQVTSTGTPQQVAVWLKKDNAAKYSAGRFVLDGSSISFVATSTMGSVEYSGQVGGDELVLQVHSLINDYRATNTYTFVSL